jgi:hypothetical protein
MRRGGWPHGLSIRGWAASHLQEPPADLSGFPVYRLRAGPTIFRNHAARLAPWWFSSSGRGRFDLVLAAGQGTCYLARTEVAGLLETFPGLQVVPEAEVDARATFEVVLARTLRLANCCASSAAQFGANAEIHDGLDYPKCQGWTARFHGAGFDGIRYFVRSDPGRQLIGYALFGAAGEAPADRWPAGASAPVSAEARRDAEKYGLRVEPTP